jgi:hypothetical protein
MKEAVRVRELGEADHAAWNDLVASSPEGSPYSTPEYLGALCEATGARFRILAAFRGEELLGGVGLYEEKSRLGIEVSPRLLLHYNGLVLRPYETKYPSVRTARHLETLAALKEALLARGYASLRLKSRHPLADVRVFTEAGWTARPSYTYVVPIDDMERLRGRIEQNLRRLVDRCEREGVAFTEDEDFESFHCLHVATHERKGTDLYLPRAAFERYFRRLRAAGLIRLYHARLHGRSISAQVVLTGRHPVAHTVSAGADAAHLKLGATAFLRFRVFEDLARRGYRANDLTDAALNPVTHFKSQLGGDLALSLTVEAPQSAPVRLIRSGRAAVRGMKHVLRRLLQREGRHAP